MIRLTQARAARKRYQQIASVLNEQSRRRFVALEARALGRGGVSLMARITGLARSTIYRGLSDVRDNVAAAPGRIRNPGGGRKKKTFEDPTLLSDLKALVEPMLWAICCARWTTACRQTVRRGKAATASIATRNF